MSNACPREICKYFIKVQPTPSPRCKNVHLRGGISNVLHEKVRNTATKIHFWRTIDKAKVDFVRETGKEVIPVEVKYQEFKKPETVRALRSFIGKYKPRQALIVNLELDSETGTYMTNIYWQHFYKLYVANRLID